MADRGESWRKHRASVKFVEQARAMEAKGLKMTPDQARKALGRWAAAGGEIPVAEVLLAQHHLFGTNQIIGLAELKRALEFAEKAESFRQKCG